MDVLIFATFHIAISALLVWWVYSDWTRDRAPWMGYYATRSDFPVLFWGVTIGRSLIVAAIVRGTVVFLWRLASGGSA